MTCTVTLSIFSWATNNCAGFIYIDENLEDVKISVIDFWGKRVDHILKIDDIVPYTENKPIPYDLFLNIRNHVNKKKIKIFHTMGRVYDEGAFTKIFGRF